MRLFVFTCKLVYIYLWVFLVLPVSLFTFTCEFLYFLPVSVWGSWRSRDPRRRAAASSRVRWRRHWWSRRWHHSVPCDSASLSSLPTSSTTTNNSTAKAVLLPHPATIFKARQHSCWKVRDSCTGLWSRFLLYGDLALPPPPQRDPLPQAPSLHTRSNLFTMNYGLSKDGGVGIRLKYLLVHHYFNRIIYSSIAGPPIVYGPYN